jgi:hypothetical protein
MDIVISGDAKNTVTVVDTELSVAITRSTTVETASADEIELTLLAGPATTVEASNVQDVTVDIATAAVTVIVASTLALSSVGPKGDPGDQGIQGVQGPAGFIASGVAVLDFGAGAMVTTTVVTELPTITAASIVTPTVRIEPTADHSVDELLFDPIQVRALDIVAGVGFTIEARMFNAPARGVYSVNWILF